MPPYCSVYQRIWESVFVAGTDNAIPIDAAFDRQGMQEYLFDQGGKRRVHGGQIGRLGPGSDGLNQTPVGSRRRSEPRQPVPALPAPRDNLVGPAVYYSVARTPCMVLISFCWVSMIERANVTAG